MLCSACSDGRKLLWLNIINTFPLISIKSRNLTTKFSLILREKFYRIKNRASTCLSNKSIIYEVTSLVSDVLTSLYWTWVSSMWKKMFRWSLRIDASIYNFALIPEKSVFGKISKPMKSNYLPDYWIWAYESCWLELTSGFSLSSQTKLKELSVYKSL